MSLCFFELVDQNLFAKPYQSLRQIIDFETPVHFLFQLESCLDYLKLIWEVW